MNRRGVAMVTVLLISSGCSTSGGSVDSQKVRKFATDYTAAWCSQQPARVAEHFAENGSLKINDGAPSVGRDAIKNAAQGFMTAFPDMVVKMDSLNVQGSHAVYHWTLAGTNSGPNGTGKAVRIHGYEVWTLAPSGLIQTSLGHYDQAEYDRQLQHGAPPP
jgi:uncharacterized protein (TIGR02246 family)